MKKSYIKPNINVLHFNMQNSLLTGSYTVDVYNNEGEESSVDEALINKRNPIWENDLWSTN